MLQHDFRRLILARDLLAEAHRRDPAAPGTPQSDRAEPAGRADPADPSGAGED